MHNAASMFNTSSDTLLIIALRDIQIEDRVGVMIYHSYIVRVFSSSTRNFIGLLVTFIHDALCVIRQ